MDQVNKTPCVHPLTRSDRVEGAAVYAVDGSRIGTIKYLEIEKATGLILYAITAFKGFLTVNAETHTIPWNKLTYDQRLHGYRTDITQDELHNAPEFSRADEFDWKREQLASYWNIPLGQ